MKKIIYISFASLISLFYSCEALSDIETGTSAERIEGTWAVDENSSIFDSKSAEAGYNVYVSVNPDDSTQVYISDFYQLGRNTEVLANVNGNSIIISKQVVDGFEIVGSGSIASNFETINMAYDVDDGSGEIDEVTAVYTKLY